MSSKYCHTFCWSYVSGSSYSLSCRTQRGKNLSALKNSQRGYILVLLKHQPLNSIQQKYVYSSRPLPYPNRSNAFHSQLILSLFFHSNQPVYFQCCVSALLTFPTNILLSKWQVWHCYPRCGSSCSRTRSCCFLSKSDCTRCSCQWRWSW